jgi:hypothetical protein
LRIQPRTNPKKKYNGQQQKEMDCDEPHLMLNEKTQPFQWTERPTAALVACWFLWPIFGIKGTKAFPSI